MKITIGIPAYNEGKNIADIVNKLKEKYESIIVCDDGSTDSTYEILKTMNVNIIKHENNRQGNAKRVRKQCAQHVRGMACTQMRT